VTLPFKICPYDSICAKTEMVLHSGTPVNGHTVVDDGFKLLLAKCISMKVLHLSQ